jgi:TolA-binding protein
MQKYTQNPISAQAGYERATLVLYTGDTTLALDVLKQTAVKYPDTEYGEQCTYKVAMYFRNKGWLDSAIIEFRKLSKSNINANMAAEAQYRIGEVYMRQNDCENAIDAYSYVKDNFAGIEDWFTLALLNIGECYERIEQPGKAIEAYRAIVTLRPDDDFGKTAKRRIKSLENNN